MPTQQRLFLGLGGNVGAVRTTIASALRLLERFLGSVRISSLYCSRALYVADQPDFLNMVASVHTNLTPQRLLWEINGVECRLGRMRRRERRMGPRCIDIDILLYGSHYMRMPYLAIPHPRLHERRFCLLPLLELAPDIRDPRNDVAFAAYLPSVATQRVRRLNG